MFNISLEWIVAAIEGQDVISYNPENIMQIMAIMDPWRCELNASCIH